MFFIDFWVLFVLFGLFVFCFYWYFVLVVVRFPNKNYNAVNLQRKNDCSGKFSWWCCCCCSWLNIENVRCSLFRVQITEVLRAFTRSILWASANSTSVAAAKVTCCTIEKKSGHVAANLWWHKVAHFVYYSQPAAAAAAAWHCNITNGFCIECRNSGSWDDASYSSTGSCGLRWMLDVLNATGTVLFTDIIVI